MYKLGSTYVIYNAYLFDTKGKKVFISRFVRIMGEKIDAYALDYIKCYV